MFGDLIIYKSGKQLKEGIEACLNREEQAPSLERSILWQLNAMHRNLNASDRYPVTVEQLAMLGM